MSGQFEKYFHNVTLDCPYGLPYIAVYRQAAFTFLSDNTINYFLENGFRRNGNYIYTMACPHCQACIAIRLNPVDFIKNRNQKRVWRRNQDLSIIIKPLQITNEKLAICDKFLKERFPDKGSSALDYYAGFFVNPLKRTYEFEMWNGRHLIGVSIIDVFGDSLNCVYYYFDPGEKKRSPGTFNILYLLDYALKKRFKYVYLGYLIKEVSAMAYKANFRSHELFFNGEWQKVSRLKKLI